MGKCFISCWKGKCLSVRFALGKNFKSDFDWYSVLIRLDCQSVKLYWSDFYMKSVYCSDFGRESFFRSDIHWESVHWPDFGRKSDFSQLFAGKVFLVRFWQKKSLLIIFHLAKWFDLIVTGEVLRLDFHRYWQGLFFGLICTGKVNIAPILEGKVFSVRFSLVMCFDQSLSSKVFFF